MKCPACNNSLVILELDSVEVDYCFVCGGIWLDAGELEELLGDSAQRDALMKSFKSATVDEHLYSCPLCDTKMKKVWVGEKQEVLIDECKNNHGLWFDQGELKQVFSLGIEKGQNKIIDLLNRMFENELKTK